MEINRGKQQTGKDQRSHQDNQRYQGEMSCKDGHNKGQKQYGPNKLKILRRGGKNNPEELYKKDFHDPDKP